MAGFKVNTGEVLVAAAVALVVMVWCFAVLEAIADPGETTKSAPQAARDLDRIETAFTKRGDPSAYPQGALCREPADAAAARLRQTLTAAASGGGMTLSEMSVNAGVPDSALGWLAPVSLHLKVTGTYDRVLGLLATLSKSRPEIFLDTADLRSETTAVSLELKGELYCSVSARP